MSKIKNTISICREDIKTPYIDDTKSMETITEQMQKVNLGKGIPSINDSLLTQWTEFSSNNLADLLTIIKSAEDTAESMLKNSRDAPPPGYYRLRLKAMYLADTIGQRAFAPQLPAVSAENIADMLGESPTTRPGRLFGEVDLMAFLKFTKPDGGEFRSSPPCNQDEDDWDPCCTASQNSFNFMWNYLRELHPNEPPPPKALNVGPVLITAFALLHNTLYNTYDPPDVDPQTNFDRRKVTDSPEDWRIIRELFIEPFYDADLYELYEFDNTSNN